MLSRVVNISIGTGTDIGIGIGTNSIIDTFRVSTQVSSILFVCSINMGIGDTFSVIFWQYSIPILLSSDALINSVNNTTVSERVKARTVVLHLNYTVSQKKGHL